MAEVQGDLVQEAAQQGEGVLQVQGAPHKAQHVDFLHLAIASAGAKQACASLSPGRNKQIQKY